jgi:hypothetical protein
VEWGGDGVAEKNMFLLQVKIFKKYLDVKSPWLPNSWFNFLFIFSKNEGFTEVRKQSTASHILLNFYIIGPCFRVKTEYFCPCSCLRKKKLARFSFWKEKSGI